MPLSKFAVTFEEASLSRGEAEETTLRLESVLRRTRRGPVIYWLGVHMSAPEGAEIIIAVAGWVGNVEWLDREARLKVETYVKGHRFLCGP